MAQHRIEPLVLLPKSDDARHGRHVRPRRVPPRAAGVGAGAGRRGPPRGRSRRHPPRTLGLHRVPPPRQAPAPAHLLQLHALMLKSSHFPHHSFPTARLLASPLAPLPYALSLFAAVPRPTLFHHTALLRAFTVCPSAASLAASLSFLASARARLPALDEFAFQPLLALCAKMPDGAEAASVGKQLHALVLRYGFLDVVSLWNVQCHFYCSCGSMADARRVFDEMPERDVISWNTVIGGYARAEDVRTAVEMFTTMRWFGMDVSMTVVVTLIGIALMDYFKCGCPDEAVSVFNAMHNRDVKAWTAIIMGFGVNGRSGNAFSLFSRMEEEGVAPNEVTFLALLSTCSHGGLVQEGKEFLERMVRHHGLSPSPEHYGCVIDLLGRAGRLDEAYELIRSMAGQDDATGWRALLAACRIHGNMKLGRMVQAQLDAMGHYHPSDAIQLSNTYASEGRWDEIARLRDLEAQKKISMEKEAGCTSIVASC